MVDLFIEETRPVFEEELFALPSHTFATGIARCEWA